MNKTLGQLGSICFFGLIAIGIHWYETHPRGRGLHHMTGDIVACQERATIDRMDELIGERDAEAAIHLAHDGISTGDCIALNAGDEILVEDQMDNGITKMRLKGNPAAYWTFSKLVGP